ncbi:MULTISPECIES: molybdate ABC transporter substrate-binding protein [Acinetobacter]|uniref:molybdate ABC transporter substrate-binding protein n=1 Tax=Acinetobacter TaxID=469 RepID=UPI000E34E822|nr:MULTISPECIES: molybdate ABC transporter substrate-binding protein [Acinetobacter]RFS26119.1 molybdate ABC transporter substrate-binding protein [Acinetobacter sp. SWAC5]RKG39950.1 molybdate ABC transporter substrate-binding protein [Acinetobacter cumulans]RZG56425.1 molybdate ABC transporter substrate-binding protein [Acinetobacter sp. WCHAc060006]
MKKALTAFLLFSLILPSHVWADVKIYAASSLNNAVGDIIAKYQQHHPERKVIPVYASSSMLAKQIQAGASSDLFFSADNDWMNYLIKQQKVEAQQTKTLLRNDLVLIAPKNELPRGKFQPNKSFRFSRWLNGYLCTGQMQSVPAGKYAKQSLTYYAWLDSLKGRVVETDNVRAALSFVERGECKLGIVYRTDALISKKVSIVGRLPKNSHQAIHYPLALTRQGQKNPEAIHLYNYLIHHIDSQKVFEHYGFGLMR